MKNVIVLVILVLLLFLPGCTGWLWEDEGVGVRLGTKITENNEIGLSATLWEEDCEPRVFGAYVIRHIPEPNVPFRNPLMLDFLPEVFQAKAYFGGKLDYNLDLNDTSLGPLAGIIIEDIFFVEYQYQSFEQGASAVSNKILFGIRTEF